MDSDYLKKYYFLERGHWWFRVREKIFLQQLHTALDCKKNLSILNVGAATGRTSEMLMEFGKVTSVEFDHDTCIFLREQLKLEVTEASATNLPFENQIFDVVCAFDVLEHIREDEKAISELYRVCKENGLLFVSCPAYSFLWSEHDIINHHYRRYTMRGLKNKVGKNFIVQYSSYFNTVLFIPIAFYRLLRRPFLKSKKNAKSDFKETGLLSNKIINKALEKVFGTELFFLKFFKLPFGVSVFLKALKEKK